MLFFFLVPEMLHQLENLRDLVKDQFQEHILIKDFIYMLFQNVQNLLKRQNIF